MKLYPFSLVLTAALLAFPLLADDGPYVVIERTYYEQCKNTFESECYYLYEQAGAEYRAMQGFLQIVQNQNNGYQYQISEADMNITIARGQLDLTDPDQVTVNSQLQAAQASLSALSDTISRNNDTFNSWQNDIHDSMVDFQNHVLSVSNSFPYVVSTTNLNIYIIVTNTFEAATNNMCCCTNEFEHFLNYYADVKSQALDLYRNTVTNLLDWSNSTGWLDYSFWIAGSKAYLSSWSYRNYSFHTMNSKYGGFVAANIFPILQTGQLQNQFSYTLPTDANFADVVAFTLQGIHDSVEQSALIDTLNKELFYLASTSTTMTVTFGTGLTNAVVQLLTAPGTYAEQVDKISKTRNWFQRIEHWLSAIAHNTSDSVEIEQESVESQESLKNDVENATNELQTAAIGIKDSFNVLPPLTNTTAALDGAVQSCSRILNSFKSSGGNRSASSAPADFRLMKADFISTTFDRLGLPENEELPYYIGADVDTPGFEHVRTASTWLHHIFGFIWLCGGLALLVYYARWLSSWVVTLWYRMLGMLVKVSKFTWGST